MGVGGRRAREELVVGAGSRRTREERVVGPSAGALRFVPFGGMVV